MTMYLFKLTHPRAGNLLPGETSAFVIRACQPIAARKLAAGADPEGRDVWLGDLAEVKLLGVADAFAEPEVILRDRQAPPLEDDPWRDE